MTFLQTSRRVVTAGFLLTAAFHSVAAAQSNSPQRVRNVVLVHGAWADGSSWSKVIPLLQRKGLNVSAVQIPLTSLEDDIAVTRRILTAQKGLTVLVGHSYGGLVITGAANSVVNVQALI